MNFQPYPHQTLGARLIHRLGGRALLADEAGAGKTATALLYHEAHREETSPVLVVCPAYLKMNWRDEIRAVTGVRADVLSGCSPPKRHAPAARVTVINYEEKVLKGWGEYLRTLKPRLVILDECQAVQSRDSKRTGAVRRLCRDVPHVVALSGTPLVNRPAELYPVLSIVRPDLFRDWGMFASRYCAPKRTAYGIDYGGCSRPDELYSLLLRTCMIRRLKSEVLPGLPAKSRCTVALDVADLTEYRAAERQFLSWLARRRPDRLAGASKAPKLTQVGYLRRLIGELKLPAVTSWCDGFLSANSKLIVFACHTATLDHLQKHFKKRCVRVDGSTPMKDRHKAVERFQKGSVPLFIGNVNAAGTGLTLTASSAVAMAELDWRPGVMAQAEDRAHRVTQTKDVTAYYLLAAGTVEERVCKILQGKQGVLNAVLDGGAHPDEMQILDLLREELKG